MTRSGAASGATSEIRTIVVTVTGEVEQPGRIRLIEGTTLKGLFEAVRPTERAYIEHSDYGYVVQDGDDIHIPPRVAGISGKIRLSDETLQRIRIRSSPKPAAIAESGSSNRAAININRATLEELQQLPRIGPETAQRLIDERQKHGPFRKKEDILRIRGIGRKTYKWLEPLIRVE